MKKKIIEENKEKIPKHVAIIMDGNGRWAKARGLPRVMGHREGVKTVRKMVTAAKDLGISYMTIYAFSTENWKRPQPEVDGLMKLFEEFLKKEKKDLMKKNVRLRFSGRREGISERLLKEMDEAVGHLAGNTALTLNIAFNYGGRAEIIDAVNRIAAEGKSITEEGFREYLYNPDIPDPELLIRTSGEMRISNFLIWEAAYSEIYVTDRYWPDFTEEDLEEALINYFKRDRRFGGVKDGK